MAVGRHAAWAVKHAAYEARPITSYEAIAKAQDAARDAQPAARRVHRQLFLAVIAWGGDGVTKPESEVPAEDTDGASSPWKETV